MPFLRLTIQPAPDAETAARLAEGLTLLMAAKLGKKAALTSVLVESRSDPLWTVGGAPVASTAMLDVSITQGTNDAAEESAFVAAAHALLQAELPDLEPVAYVVLTEVPAENWGYDGTTQAERRVATAT